MLDHALSGPEGSENCEKFVEALGLKTLFAAFVSPTPHLWDKTFPVFNI